MVVDTVGPRRHHQPPRRITFADGSWINNREYQRHRRSRRQYWINKYKCGKGCELCGYNAHGVALDFDHLDRAKKNFNPSSQSMTHNLKRLFDEIRKCRILCANCHRIHTFEEKHYRNYQPIKVYDIG